jgi:hypothetical protein
MQKIIIFDSPDGTGKTNIAQALANQLTIPYFKYHGEHEFWKGNKFATALEFDQKFMAHYLYQTGHSLIWDRAYPSEWVYSQVFNRETNEDLIAKIDEMYSTMGAWIVVPLRDNYMGSREDELVPGSELRNLHDMYNLFCDDFTKCNTLRIYVDTFDNDITQELDAITSELSFYGGNKVQKSIVLRGR